MRVITSHEKAAGVADQWFNRYGSQGWCGTGLGGDSKKIYEKLRALGSSPDPRKVDEIIGNTSWTMEDCATCGIICARWLAVRTEEKLLNICEKCLSAAHKQMFPNGE